MRVVARPTTDLDDQWIVAAAIDGEADFLVTGDRDLLDVAAGVSVTIVSPREFWERLR
jgi:predicted nucleic acid-binding protein